MYYGEEIGMTDLPQPFATALDPIPHKFKSIPRFIFDLLGVLINRDEVRTPMQWDGTKNAGFSSAKETWLPVHGNYSEINVQKESKDEDSLLNVIRSLMNVRNGNVSLREGSLELLSGLPNGVLGYERKFKNEKITILLNFSEQAVEFQFKFTECIFTLSDKDHAKEKAILLNGLGGIIVTM